MFNIRGLILSVALLMLSFPAYAQKATTEESPTKNAATEEAAAKKALTEKSPEKNVATKKAAAKKSATKKSPAKNAVTEKATAQKATAKKSPAENAATEKAAEEKVSKEQIKGLDEQVQETKSDVLGIAAELNQLEEKLLYPSNTQIAVFVSLVSGDAFRPDSVEIQVDGKPVARHIYSFKELEALQKGGVQRIYTGNVRSGEHDLQVFVMGKTGGGADFQKSEHFKVSKDVGPKIVEISLAAQSITLK